MTSALSTRPTRLSRLVLVPTVLACAALLAACGGGDGDKKPATQVAAKVNSGEISVHQVNQVLQRQPGLKPEQVQAVSRRVLDGLVDQELAIQQATEQKLDRDPRVVSAIEAAKRHHRPRLCRQDRRERLRTDARGGSDRARGRRGPQGGDRDPAGARPPRV